jgi:hypothetical protein
MVCGVRCVASGTAVSAPYRQSLFANVRAPHSLAAICMRSLLLFIPLFSFRVFYVLSPYTPRVKRTRKNPWRLRTYYPRCMTLCS